MWSRAPLRPEPWSRSSTSPRPSTRYFPTRRRSKLYCSNLYRSNPYRTWRYRSSRSRLNLVMTLPGPLSRIQRIHRRWPLRARVSARAPPQWRRGRSRWVSVSYPPMRRWMTLRSGNPRGVDRRRRPAQEPNAYRAEVAPVASPPGRSHLGFAVSSSGWPPGSGRTHECLQGTWSVRRQGVEPSHFIDEVRW